MTKRQVSGIRNPVSAQPRLHQKADESQAYGTVSLLLPLELEEAVRLEMTEQLNTICWGTLLTRKFGQLWHARDGSLWWFGEQR